MFYNSNTYNLFCGSCPLRNIDICLLYVRMNILCNRSLFNYTVNDVIGKISKSNIIIIIFLDGHFVIYCLTSLKILHSK